MSDLGTDYSAIPDLAYRTKTGFVNLAEALARRLQTPRGGLHYDPSYGLDIREWLNETDGDEARFELATLAAAECEADPRVFSASAEVLSRGPNEFRLSIQCESLDGPFALILKASAVTVEVLNANLG